MTPLDLFRLDARVALVTGAARGIGREIAVVLAGLGARVALVDRDPPDEWRDDAARALAAATVSQAPLRPAREGAGAGDRASYHRADVTRTDECRRAIGEVTAHWGRLDVLVNNAGINAKQAAVDIDDASWQRILDVNLGGVFRMCREAHGALAASEAPAIVNLSSGVSHYAVKDNAHYATSKAGINHLTRLLALEWAGERIRVNAVAPTVVPTAMSAAFTSNPQYVAAKLAATPLGRFATPTEIAVAVAFLASPAASMITGQVLYVDGGCSIA